jgi:ubiquinone/menaquinone biosynthesis C-methylase UbiE
MPGDAFRFINDLDAATVERIAARLEFRATDPGYAAFGEAYLAKLPLATARRVLALGCGTGVEVRALKRHPAFAGEVVGIDHSRHLVTEAQRLTAAEGLDAGVEYRVGDAHALDLADASFDVVLAHTLVSHVTDPAQVLHEACRVLAPGGTVAVFDGDYASLTFAHPDPDLAKHVDETLLEVLVNNPRVMRDLPRLLREAGLELVDASSHAYADIGTGGYFANFVQAFAPLLAGSGLLPDEDVARWRAWQAQALAEGTFFGASNFYAYLARRPANPAVL